MTASLMDLQPQLTIGVSLDVGQSRREEANQDSIGIYAEYCDDAAWLLAKGRLFVVADGMGGAAGGKEASEMAVQIIMDSYYQDMDLEIAPSLECAIQEANRRINELGRTTRGLRGLGTTLVGVVIRGQNLVVANVGDSRAYLLRQDTLRQLSIDHTSVQEQVREGLLTPEEAIMHPRRHVLSRNLGSRPRVHPDVITETLAEGDTLLLCSDGLWGPTGEMEIAEVLQHERGQDAANALVERANQHGGPDNISAVVIHVDELGTADIQDGASELAITAGNTKALKPTPGPAAPAMQPQAYRQSFKQLWRWALIGVGTILLLLGLLSLRSTASTAPLQLIQTVEPSLTPRATHELKGAIPSPVAPTATQQLILPLIDVTTTPPISSSVTLEAAPKNTLIDDVLNP